MKKLLFLGAMAAMLLGTASCSKDMEPEMSDGTVQFKVELPGNIDSRSISDGTTATELEVACYDADGNYIPTLVAPTTITITPFNERVATVTMKLVKGQKYQFAFFAHAENAPYAFSAGTKLSECSFTVTDNYTGDDCVSNAENRDAFYATLTGYEVTSATTEVELHRPFAQLNFGTDDLAAAEAAGIIPGQSMVTVKQVATSFNLSTGATAGAVDATFALAARPTEKLVVDKEYDWMAMNYFLVPNNEANVDVEMTVKTNKADVVVPVTSVPVKKNHRTNILGSLFTQEGKFNVIIDQDFDTPDYNVEPINPILVKTEEELIAALDKDDKNIYIKLLNDVQLSYGARTAYGHENTESITIDGDGHTLNLKGTDTDWSSFGGLDGVNFTLKNMTVYKTEGGNGAWNNHAINLSNRVANGEVGINTGKFYLQNVTFNNAVCIQNDAEIENCNFIEPGAYYVFYINANVKNTTINNCTFSAKLTTGDKGRGIKVNDQYVDAADRVQCNINISNCSFETMKKAAILVTNTAGAKITASNLDISKVAADNINAVWNDEDRAAAWDLVEVYGCTKKQEGQQ